MAYSKNPHGERRDDNGLDAARNEKMQESAILSPAGSPNEMLGNRARIEVY
jgi:hypothetical protein